MMQLVSCSTEDLNCYPEELRESILLSYQFTEGSFNDFSGNNYNLDYAENVNQVLGRNGDINGAIEFPEERNSFAIREDASFMDDRSSFSVSAWIKLTQGVNTKSIQGIVSRDSIPTCPDRIGQWSLSLFDCSRAVFAINESSWTNWLSGNILNCNTAEHTDNLADEWIHIVGVKDEDQVNIYRNGILEDTQEGIANCSNFRPSRNIGALLIGFRFKGTVDDITIFDKAISDEEVDLLFKVESC